MISLEEAYRIIDSAMSGVRLPCRVLPACEAMGQTLSSDQYSQLDLPPFDKSAMDGYAIKLDEKSTRYRLLDTVAAGHVCDISLQPGTAVKVMTGAPVPKGTDRVVMIEHVSEDDGWIQILEEHNNTNICRQAEDVHIGDRIFEAGTRLNAMDVANLISCGITHVESFCPMRVAILSTGDEIVDHPAQLRPGKIINSNGPMLKGLAAYHGLDVTTSRSVADDLSQISQSIRDALKEADCVMITGGVSVGDCDWVPQAIEQAGGEIRFSKLAVKPGKPTVFATAGTKAVFGLPGNPVSVFLMFHLFVLYVQMMLTGGQPALRTILLPLAHSYQRRRAERMEFRPCRLTSEGTLSRIEYHGSAHLHAISNADGVFIVPAGICELDKGQQAEFLPFGRSMR